MTLGRKILTAFLVAAGLASGLACVMRFSVLGTSFSEVGFSNSLTVVFGLVQILGSVMILSATTRRFGKMLMVLTFLLVAMVLFISRHSQWALFLILPAILALVLLLTKPKVVGE